MIWGCLIGLPAYLLAQLSQETSLFGQLLGEGLTSEEVAGALYLINGVLCLFVVEAVRRPTVVNVWIPLRRATAFGLLLSVPVLFLHKQIEAIDEYIHMPYWAWVAVASGLVYLIARAHEFATELVNRLFDREFIRAERHLAAVGETIHHVRQPRRGRASPGERADAFAPSGVGGAVSRAGRRLPPKRASAGWDADDADALASDDPLLAARFERKPYTLDTVDAAHASHARLPRRPRAAGSRRAGRQSATLLRA